MEISVIIPVYNAEKYIERCLDSILTSLGKIKGEIIVVDNNSSDNSLMVLKRYAKEYPKIITVLEHKTSGASAARNFGATKAKGEYIWFIDADDAIAKDAIPDVLREAKVRKADFVMPGTDKYLENGEKKYLPALDPKDSEFKSKFIRRAIGPWQVIIRREWWEKNGFRFKEGIIHEDLELMPTLILHTDNYASVDKPLYYYYWNSNSVLHKAKWDRKYFDIFPALEGLYNHFKEANALEIYHDELEWFFVWNLLIDSAGDFKKFREGRSGFKRSRKMLKKYFPNWLENRFLNQKKMGTKFKLRVVLSYHGIVI